MKIFAFQFDEIITKFYVVKYFSILMKIFVTWGQISWFFFWWEREKKLLQSISKEEEKTTKNGHFFLLHDDSANDDSAIDKMAARFSHTDNAATFPFEKKA